MARGRRGKAQLIVVAAGQRALLAQRLRKIGPPRLDDNGNAANSNLRATLRCARVYARDRRAGRRKYRSRCWRCRATPYPAQRAAAADAGLARHAAKFGIGQYDAPCRWASASAASPSLPDTQISSPACAPLRRNACCCRHFANDGHAQIERAARGVAADQLHAMLLLPAQKIPR